MQKDDMRQISVELEETAKELTAANKTLSTENPWIQFFSKLTFPHEMSRELVETAIERIDVLSPDDAQAVFVYQEWFTRLWEFYQKETDYESRH